MWSQALMTTPEALEQSYFQPGVFYIPEAPETDTHVSVGGAC